ncbi:hypothetical protein [Actinomadura sp. 9N215]|uniref:hypothetical protein n=1 Tax=Actinomadura sp. 9N215 TaxID=3375150 RepID=UPI0037874E71
MNIRKGRLATLALAAPLAVSALSVPANASAVAEADVYKPGNLRGCIGWVGTRGGYSQGHVKCAGKRVYVKVRVQCARGQRHESNWRWEYNHADCRISKEGRVTRLWYKIGR